MKIGAYQFEVTGNPEHNFTHLVKGVEEAAKKNIRLLLFPKCAVTGYFDLLPEPLNFAEQGRKHVSEQLTAFTR